VTNGTQATRAVQRETRTRISNFFKSVATSIIRSRVSSGVQVGPYPVALLLVAVLATDSLSETAEKVRIFATVRVTAVVSGCNHSLPARSTDCNSFYSSPIWLTPVQTASTKVCSPVKGHRRSAVLAFVEAYRRWRAEG
jgi:hypothetical protein